MTPTVLETEEMPFDYRTAVTRAQAAAADYYAGTGLQMTDAEYDQLLVEIEQYEAAYPNETIEHGLFTDVAAGAVTGGDVTHPVPMLSLEKTTDEDGIRKFLQRVADAERSVDGVELAKPIVSVQPKLDGMAIRAVYLNGALTQVVTRGDGRTGEDVTDRVRRANVVISGLPWVSRGDFEVRGELLMSRNDFAISNANRIASGKTGFANPRNATAGSVRAETLDYTVAMTFVTYDHDDAPDDGFVFADDLPGAGQYRAIEVDALIEQVERFGTIRADYDFPTDGIVVKVDDPRVRDEMGTGSRAPKWAIAYKYEAQTGESTIRDIVIEVGRTGNLSFTAVFDPVLVDGSTISRASLHNVDQIREKDIRIGSRATVYKANDIIPQVLSVVNGEGTVPWTPPTEDADGFAYDTNQTIWRSTNPSDSISALLSYAASRDVLDIDGLGRSVADALVDAGLVNDLADLFEVTQSELATLPMGETATGGTRRFGDANAAKVYANIQSAKLQPLNRVITALGIRLTGRTFGRRLAAHFRSLQALRDATAAELTMVEGIAEGRAVVIHDGLTKNREVIDRLIGLGVTSTAEEVATDAGAPALSGMVVVVTGSTKGTKLEAYGRNEMNELIERHGGRSSGSVSKSTSLLVAGDGAGSKLAKANELGVRVVNPDEFAGMVGL